MRAASSTTCAATAKDAVANLTEPEDPKQFTDREIAEISMITLLRIYDTLATLLHQEHPAVAESLVTLHEQGKILMSPPRLELDDSD